MPILQAGMDLKSWNEKKKEKKKKSWNERRGTWARALAPRNSKEKTGKGL